MCIFQLTGLDLCIILNSKMDALYCMVFAFLFGLVVSGYVCVSCVLSTLSIGPNVHCDKMILATYKDCDKQLHPAAYIATTKQTNRRAIIDRITGRNCATSNHSNIPWDPLYHTFFMHPLSPQIICSL